MSSDTKILDLLKIIVCPQCRGKLVLESEALLCGACALEYPIRNGIPVLLLDAAIKRG